MREKIYTIPVNEAFRQDCECPVCILEKDLEDKRIEYTLGPSLMEPDSRIETNDKGFCRRHYRLLYNRQENRLGMGLIIDTHLKEQIGKMKKICRSHSVELPGQSNFSLLKGLTGLFQGKSQDAAALADKMLEYLEAREKKCAICDYMETNMQRYIEVILDLYFSEKEFKKIFLQKKGFCMDHFKALLIGAKKYLKGDRLTEFVNEIVKMQIENLERIEGDVEWFTKKFDYRYENEPWKNSRDAIIRSVQKLARYNELK